MEKDAFTNSRLYHLLSVFAELVLLNLVTILCSLPVITVGAASVALYDAVEHLQNNEGNLGRRFFRTFRENLRQVTILWIVLLVLGAAIAFCILFCREIGFAPVLILACVAALIWCAVVSWLFPLAAKFVFPARDAIKNAALCAVAYWPVSLLMVATNFLPAALLVVAPGSFLQIGFLWLTVWFSAASFCNLKLLNGPFQQLARENHFDE